MKTRQANRLWLSSINLLFLPREIRQEPEESGFRLVLQHHDIFKATNEVS